MLQKRAIHLNLCQADLEGATLALIPGDPARVKRIAEMMDDAHHLATHREFTLWLAHINEEAVVVCSTGIGGPSTSIAVEELAQLGIRTFLRIGTTGTIQSFIRPSELIVTTGAVRLDGASLHFAPMEFPAVADFACAQALIEAAKKNKITAHIGITASTDTFYPGQERYDTFSGRVTRRFKHSLTAWQQMGVLNYEMEAATLFTMCATQGLRAGMVAGVIVNRLESEAPQDKVIQATEHNAIRVAVDAAGFLLK